MLDDELEGTWKEVGKF